MQSLRRRIDGAGDLQGVVRSMKALAASSIGQYERAVQSLEDYYRTIELGLSVCLRESRLLSPDPVPLPPKRAQCGAIVFGSDQGLVGRFNEVLVEFVERSLSTQDAPEGKPAKIWAVGERAHALLSDAGLKPIGPLPVPASVNAITPLVGRILIEIEAAREREAVFEVQVFHNHPVSGASYEPAAKLLLPLDRAWREKLAALPWPTTKLPEVISPLASTLQAFLRGYLFVVLFQACAESLAAENASRLAAMQRAEKNIGDILAGLNRDFHRIRQESIDEELFDVLSGFEALSSE